MPYASPAANVAVAIFADPKMMESPSISPSLPPTLPASPELQRYRPIELQDIKHSRFFSTEVVSIRKALADDDY